MLALAGVGLILAKDYHDGSTTRSSTGWYWPRAFSWRTRFVLPEAGLFLVLGLWLLLAVDAPGAGLLKALIGRWRDPRRGGITPAYGLLLIPVAAMALLLLGPRYWFGMQFFEVTGIVLVDVALATASLVLVFRSRVWAATVAAAGLLVLGGYGLVIASFWPGRARVRVRVLRPEQRPVHAQSGASPCKPPSCWPRPVAGAAGDAPSPGPADPELAARAQQLTQRVQTLTQTRSNAVDTAAAELRRIERDLHDGAQARMVAVG